MRSEDLPPPPVIPGYEILRTLGGGGMGVVYLARQLSLDRVIALKLLTTGPNANAIDLARRFRREAELMARIKHANIVTVFEFSEFEGLPFLTMEYVEGKDLRHAMQPGKPLEIGQVRSLTLPLASALDCLHKNKILHRDLKPENILIGPNFSPIVSDFGIAVEYSSAGSLTTKDQWLGTIGYVAPEQQYRLNVDERADQYSMAAVMYEALTGQKALGVFKPPSQWNSLVHPRVDDVLMRALQEDRDDRFPTILDFGNALDATLTLPTAPAQIPSRRAILKVAAVAAASVAASSWGFIRLVTPTDAKVDPDPPLWQNDQRIWFQRIPAAPEFMMGGLADDSLTKPAEIPAHPVRLMRPFSVSLREITVGQFREFVTARPYVTEAEANGLGGHVHDSEQDVLIRDPRFIWSNPTGNQAADDDDPVVQVSWNDAVAYCNWLTETDREKRTYRLLTEAEWEYACRGKNEGRWCMGNDVKALDSYAWTETNAPTGPHHVGEKAPNAFGLFDMHGNVWEWTQDGYAPYTSEPAFNPTGPETPTERVLRGGSWEKGERMQTRSSARRDSPADYSYFAYGFRICVPE